MTPRRSAAKIRETPPGNRRRAVAAVEAELVKRVRERGRISRVELARDLRIVPSTAGIYVDRLVEEGFLLEETKADRGFGRPPTLLALNPRAGRFIGVDFEARNILATAVDFSQRSLRRMHRRVAASDTPEQILRKIEDAIAGVTGPRRRDVLGIGIGLPGVIDPGRGVAVGYAMIPGWQDIPIGARLEARFGAPVSLENNIRSMALAEMWFGQGRGAGDFVCLGIRSGIAAGIVIEGRLLRGRGHRAGEIGHWSCPGLSLDGGRALEEAASLTAILAEIERARTRGIKTSLARVRGAVAVGDFIRAVVRGDAFATRLLGGVARLYGWVVHQLSELFDTERIILAGPLTAFGERLLEPIRETARALSPRGAHPEIACSTLGEYNGALGAAALALHQWTPDRCLRH